MRSPCIVVGHATFLFVKIIFSARKYVILIYALQSFKCTCEKLRKTCLYLNEHLCLLMNVFTALKGSHFWFLFDFTAAGVGPCGGRKTSPRTSSIVQFIFYFGPLRSSIIFWEIRNRWLVYTHILDRFLFIWTPFWFMSVFESTAYLKSAKLQYVSSGFRCRVIAESLMRLY